MIGATSEQRAQYWDTTNGPEGRYALYRIELGDGEIPPELYVRTAPQAATARSAPVVPEGWKLVPVEPNENMLTAAACTSGDDWIAEAGSTEGHSYRKHIARKEYAAMLAAAPSHPEPAGGKEGA